MPGNHCPRCARTREHHGPIRTITSGRTAQPSVASIRKNKDRKRRRFLANLIKRRLTLPAEQRGRLSENQIEQARHLGVWLVVGEQFFLEAMEMRRLAQEADRLLAERMPRIVMAPSFFEIRSMDKERLVGIIRSLDSALTALHQEDPRRREWHRFIDPQLNRAAKGRNQFPYHRMRDHSITVRRGRRHT